MRLFSAQPQEGSRTRTFLSLSEDDFVEVRSRPIIPDIAFLSRREVSTRIEAKEVVYCPPLSGFQDHFVNKGQKSGMLMLV